MTELEELGGDGARGESWRESVCACVTFAVYNWKDKQRRNQRRKWDKVEIWDKEIEGGSWRYRAPGIHPIWHSLSGISATMHPRNWFIVVGGNAVAEAFLQSKITCFFVNAAKIRFFSFFLQLDQDERVEHCNPKHWKDPNKWNFCQGRSLVPCPSPPLWQHHQGFHCCPDSAAPHYNLRGL